MGSGCGLRHKEWLGHAHVVPPINGTQELTSGEGEKRGEALEVLLPSVSAISCLQSPKAHWAAQCFSSCLVLWIHLLTVPPSNADINSI